MITLLTGDNGFMIDQQLKLAASEFGGTPERFDGSELELKQLPDLFMGATLFASHRQLILKDVTSNKTVWTDLADWLERVGEETEVILVEPNADKRTKTYKWIQKNATVRQSDLLRPDEAVRWVQEEGRSHDIDLDRQLASYLVDYVGVDQWMLRSEIEKLALSGKPVTLDLIRELVEPNPQATAFELLDAAFRSDGKEVERLISQLQVSEDPYRFFSLLSSQVFAIAAVAAGEGKSTTSIASDVGLHPYVVQKCVPLARRLSKKALNSLITKLAELDMNLKSRGVEPWIQIRTALGAMRNDT